MTLNPRVFSLFLLYLLPISLITGPAIPDISITLIGILFLINIFIKKNFDFLREFWVRTGLLFWIILLILSFFSKNIFQSFIESFIFLRYILLIIAINFWIIKKEKELNFLIGIILFSLLFIILDCFYQYFGYTSYNGFGKDVFGFVSTHYGRLTGPFNEQIPGAHLSRFIFIPLILFLYKWHNSNLKQFFIVIYLVSGFYIIWISGEAMAFATLIMGIVFYLILINRLRKVFLLATLIFFFSIYYTISNHKIFNDFEIIESTPYHLGLKIEKKYICDENPNKICSKEITTNPEAGKVIKNFNKSIYYMIYSEGIKMWKDNIFVGIGLSNFEDVCMNEEKYRLYKKNYGECSSHPHNFYLQWLVETGVIGLLFFLIFVLSIFFKIFKNFNFLNARISFISLMILFWPVMSTGSLIKNWNGVEFFFIIGISLLISNKYKSI